MHNHSYVRKAMTLATFIEPSLILDHLYVDFIFSVKVLVMVVIVAVHNVTLCASFFLATHPSPLAMPFNKVPTDSFCIKEAACCPNFRTIKF